MNKPTVITHQSRIVFRMYYAAPWRQYWAFAPRLSRLSIYPVPWFIRNWRAV